MNVGSKVVNVFEYRPRIWTVVAVDSLYLTITREDEPQRLVYRNEYRIVGDKEMAEFAADRVAGRETKFKYN